MIRYILTMVDQRDLFNVLDFFETDCHFRQQAKFT